MSLHRSQPPASPLGEPEPPILVINAGSSSLKFALLRGEWPCYKGLIDGLGHGSCGVARAMVRDGHGQLLHKGSIVAQDHSEALDWLFVWLDGAKETPHAVGHRVVHGGDELIEPVIVDAGVMARIEALIPLAPLHQAHNLAPMRVIADRFPDLPQVACFDTAFHASLPRLERLLALPRIYAEKSIRRYGFHGLSYEYIASRLPAVDPKAAWGQTVVCHLGNGASMCALQAARSIATTMSFSTLDGLPMGTRCGALDPGVLLHLLDHEGLTPRELTELLYHRSGLLGLSGLSADMRELLASTDPKAIEAVDYFCYRIARELGSLTAVLGGLDALVFTGGIGEHAAPVRANVCARSRWLGVVLNTEANERGDEQLHDPASAVAIYRIPTDEEAVIARHVTRLLASTDRA